MVTLCLSHTRPTSGGWTECEGILVKCAFVSYYYSRPSLTLGPRVIQISEKFGLLKCVLINVEASKGTNEYHYEFMNIIISGIVICKGSN